MTSHLIVFWQLMCHVSHKNDILFFATFLLLSFSCLSRYANCSFFPGFFFFFFGLLWNMPIHPFYASLNREPKNPFIFITITIHYNMKILLPLLSHSASLSLSLTLQALCIFLTVIDKCMKRRMNGWWLVELDAL